MLLLRHCSDVGLLKTVVPSGAQQLKIIGDILLFCLCVYQGIAIIILTTMSTGTILGLTVPSVFHTLRFPVKYY